LRRISGPFSPLISHHPYRSSKAGASLFCPLGLGIEIMLDKRRYPALWMVLGKTHRMRESCSCPMRKSVAWLHQRVQVDAAFVRAALG